MGPLELNSQQTPTRIPRPTFVASSPRTPSIRAVPYSHMDRATTSSGVPRSYSPSSWPFPKLAKSSSLDLSATTDHCDASRVDREDMNGAEETQFGHRATRSAASGLTTTASLREARRDHCAGGHTRANVSFDSVETQIYAPRHGVNRLSAQPSHPNSVKTAFLDSAPEVLERPMTPTPYSILRKVSETTEPGNEEQLSLHDCEQPGSGLGHRETTRCSSTTHTPQHPVARGSPINNSATRINMSGTHTALATPVLRDEEGRVLSRLHPLSRASSVINEPPSVLLYAGPSSTVQAEHGSSDGGTAAGVPEGIVILQPVETQAADGASTQNISLYSRRPTTVGSVVPDLESLRRGPRLRHSRLPLSPSMAANAGRSVPKSTKKLWTAFGRSRKMMLVSAILLKVFILNAVSSVTAMIVTHIENGHPGSGHPGSGLVTWAAVSSVFALTFGGLMVVVFLQYRKLNKDVVSGENWIEMHLRSRPLPPRPQGEERRQEDNGATEAWQKFTKDHEQLRRYVEFLEGRIGVLEEGQPRRNQGNDGPNVDITVAGNNSSGALHNDTVGLAIGGEVYGNPGDNTPKASKLNIGGSLSRRQLLQPEDSVTEAESWQGSERNGTVPKSDTKASILTELCEAVTEGYSPLSEQMPRGSPHVPQTPDTHTPSSRQRGNQSLRHLVLPGRAANQRRDAQTAPTF